MSYNLHIPTTLEEALEIKRKTDGTYLAAGTVLLVNHRHQEDLIALEKIKGLSEIEDGPDYVKIGALSTFSQLESSPVIRAIPALWQASYHTAGPQIRNRATIGGNIGCFSPASDSVTSLVALDSKVELYDGSFHTVRIEDLKSVKDAIITAVIIPKRFSVSVFEKVGKRNAMSVSVINMAMARSREEVRLAVGCVDRQVVYCRKTSEILSKHPADMKKAQESLLSEIHPINDRWGNVEYKNTVAVNLLNKLSKEVIL